MRIPYYTIVLALFIFFSACKRQDRMADKAPDKAAMILQNLQGAWNLVEMDGRNVHQFNANVKFVDTLASIYSGCNSMSGIKVTTDDADHNIAMDCSLATATLVGCPMKHIEGKYFELMCGAYHLVQKENVLVISTITGVELLFTKRRE